MKRRWTAPALVAAAVALTLGSAGASSAPPAQDAKPSAHRVVFFASDGMRPDLMERYAAQGAMPTYKQLMDAGVRGENGLQQAFPPNTGVGWYTLATGTWPSEHGSTNNTFFRTGDAWNNRTSFSGAGVLQADTLAASAERAGKKVAQVDWVGGASAGIKGPTVDYANFFSTRGVLATANSVEQAGAASFGISFQVATFLPAAGWTNVPTSYSPALESAAPLSVTSTFASQYATRTFNVYLYDGTDNATVDYDHVLLAPAKDAAAAAATLGKGDWKNVKVQLTGTRAGQTAGFYVKLIASAPTAFKLYFTSVARGIATCSTAACAALPGGLESYIADNFPSYVAADYAPLEARVIDEDTYVQQGRDLEAAYADAVLRYVLGTLQPDTDLAFVGYPVTDEFQHQFMGLVTAKDMDGQANPWYDDADYDGVKDNRVAIREGYLRSAYAGADEKLALARQLVGGNPTTVASSDHGFAAQWYAVNGSKILVDAGLQTAEASNCRAAAADLAKICVAGGTAQIYVNPSQTGAAYEAVRTAAIAAFQNLTDPANPGKQVVLKVMKKEELKNVQGVDALHPSRSGDVVVVLRPPYQFDAATAGQRIALSNFFGQHGYLPDLVDLAANVNMHGTFVAAGDGFRHQGPVEGVRAIDLAPTIAFLLDVPGPLNARGKILYDLFPTPGHWKEATLLSISDFHGQLTPLTQTADTLGPSFGIGGAAYLKPWFDWYRGEAQGPSLTLSGGDSVGASPAISNAFGDKPTMNVLNMLGLSVDTLGNHNFDRGSAYLRNELIPLAKFPYLSANTVFAANGAYPPEWKPSAVFDFDGFKLGVVGYTLPDLASLIFPGYLDPFKVTDPVAAVNAEAAKLTARGNLNAVVAVGHLGGDGTNVTAPLPSSPLLQLANAVQGVDVVLGGHTHTQYVTTAANGVLVAESPNAGQRFTRIRLVVDTATKQVVYKTADFHKPWDIGVTPDPQIDAYVADLNAQLAPIMNTVIGSSSVKVPRADSCGRGDGRLCESLIGDVATDALRTTYATDFAITNSGGLRADLTCPFPDVAGDFCPAFTPPPYPITRGSVLGVLPFGNVVFTVNVTGAELKTFLENGVSLMPAAQGRFPQVSGLCFTYDISKPAGSRVLGAVRQAADGSCTGAAVDLTGASTYRIAENDFMATGGDGYPNVYSRGTTQDLMDQVVANYITAKTPIAPALQGRVVCTTSGATACPVPVP